MFLGLNGVVVKSHGSADARGVASAIRIADSLARRDFLTDVEARVGEIMPTTRTNTDEERVAPPAVEPRAVQA